MAAWASLPATSPTVRNRRLPSWRLFRGGPAGSQGQTRELPYLFWQGGYESQPKGSAVGSAPQSGYGGGGWRPPRYSQLRM